MVGGISRGVACRGAVYRAFCVPGRGSGSLLLALLLISDLKAAPAGLKYKKRETGKKWD